LDMKSRDPSGKGPLRVIGVLARVKKRRLETREGMLRSS
jgi:hypothetical protein